MKLLAMTVGIAGFDWGAALILTCQRRDVRKEGDSCGLGPGQATAVVEDDRKRRAKDQLRDRDRLVCGNAIYD
jgi:hypothetical protein